MKKICRSCGREIVEVSNAKKKRARDIAVEMKLAGVSENLVAAAVEASKYSEGICDLMAWWQEETGNSEREGIEAAIKNRTRQCFDCSMLTCGQMSCWLSQLELVN